MENYLKKETSPYLLQHAQNPVNWYPWCKEAFEKAAKEDKPVFLSIGYSTCHWCHVMAHESFEDKETAELLNAYFVSIKVDREERPDIDSVYMAFCQAFTGSGGWPMSIFMTPEQKPFFAGTYFPKKPGFGMQSFKEILLAVADIWKKDRSRLLSSAGEIVRQLKMQEQEAGQVDKGLLEEAVSIYWSHFDQEYGGFGSAPKFPVPHNILFLLQYYKSYKDILPESEKALKMAEKTLMAMYQGGIFDHIGYGFSRYSTDRFFLAPHFEKMLYDNALLILAYAKAYEVTGKVFYLTVAEQTAAYILREMTDFQGGFYCAQDADSQGEEGGYYVFGYEEITEVLGKAAGSRFNSFYGITKQGNFEGKNIPNLLQHNIQKLQEEQANLKKEREALYQYRKGRKKLHLDDKILTSWNALMIAALSFLYQVSGKEKYRKAAGEALYFIKEYLLDGAGLLVSFRKEVSSGKGFLEDYAFYAFALLKLYQAERNPEYLEEAARICKKAIQDFYDEEKGGFYLSGAENEKLILAPKETYDGAIPSGNSVMSYVLTVLSQLTEDFYFEKRAKEQREFLFGQAKDYPIGHSFYLLTLLRYFNPPEHITVVLKEGENMETVASQLPADADVRILKQPEQEYKRLEGETTFYVCRNHTCLPPVKKLKP